MIGSNDPRCAGDQRLEALDSLTYVSEPVTADTEITGPISATLYASSTAEDTDWIVKVIDIFPDGTMSPASPQPGYWNLITTGWLKGTHREGHVTPLAIPPGEVIRYDVEVFATSYLVREGHRIALQVASADAARTWPNPNPATNSIFRTPEYPSHVTLPIVPR